MHLIASETANFENNYVKTNKDRPIGLLSAAQIFSRDSSYFGTSVGTQQWAVPITAGLRVSRCQLEIEGCKLLVACCMLQRCMLHVLCFIVVVI